MGDEFLLIVVTTITDTSGLGLSFAKFSITVMPFFSSSTVNGAIEPVSKEYPYYVFINTSTFLLTRQQQTIS